MIVLDTQVLSQLQRSQSDDHERLARKLKTLGDPDVRITVISPFDAKVVQRIKAMDARIAAIALAHNATLLSANLRDFKEVPGLRVEDW